MDVYAQIAEKIIEGQEAIIGPVAVEQAKQVANLVVDWEQKSVTIVGDKVQAIEDLVQTYQNLFGQISVEVSKESAADVLASLANDLRPLILRDVN